LRVVFSEFETQIIDFLVPVEKSIHNFMKDKILANKDYFKFQDSMNEVAIA
jgi:hypothetical protein